MGFKNIIAFALFFFLQTLFGQNKKIDSLQKALSVIKSDTEKVNIYNNLSFYYDRISDYKMAIANSRKALKISKEISFPKGEAGAYSLLGTVCMKTSLFDSSIFYYTKALTIRLKLGDKKMIATSYNNLGGIYLNIANFPAALQYFKKSLALREEINDKFGIAVCYTNLGNLAGSRSNYPEALEYHFKALKMKEDLIHSGNTEVDSASLAKSYTNVGMIYQLEDKQAEALVYQLKALKIRSSLGDKNGISQSYNSLGNISYNQKNNREALSYFEKCLAINKEIGDESDAAATLNNMAVIFKEQGLYEKSLQYLQEAEKIYLRIGEEEGLLNSDINFGSIYFHLKKYNLAEEYYKKAYAASQKFEITDDLKECCLGLSEVYKAQGKFETALDYYQKYTLFKDSISNEEASNKIVRAEMNYDFEKKKAVENAAHEKEVGIAVAESKKQKIIIGSVCGILLLVLGFAVYAYRSNLQKQKINRELDIKNKKIENAYVIIEERNKEVTDSIHYANRIQRAMITSDSYISQFLRNYFIVYQPKDIVSGDFYWAVNHTNKFYIAVADCTGHGVPGAFMSLLNISFLNENVIEKNIAQPNVVLNEQRKHIIKALNPIGNEDSKDGMDCVLAAFDFKALTLEYAAANNSFYIIRNGELIICAADKMPVGKSPNESTSFTNQKVQLQKNDSVYIFTDGYADQFGGPKGKKFKYKQLEEILLANCNLPVEAQKEILSERFNSWKGNLEQVDDVLIIGIKI
jgi:tetratricopeptide (TPR) repeat protein